MKKHLIYAYKKNDNNKIVYVGQTDNLQRRNEQHIKYEEVKKWIVMIF